MEKIVIHPQEVQMKQFSTFLNGVLVSILAFVLFFSLVPNAKAEATPTPAPTAESQPSACNPARTVQVSGTAVVNVVPDRALIELGVQSNGKSAAAVQAANAAAIERVTKAILAQGVDAKDISTDWYIIEPLYEDYDSLAIKGYRINNTVAITLRDVKKTNLMMTAAMQAGANQVINVELYTSELRKYRDQARDLAMRAALEKAQALASAGGAQAGCVLNITENTWSSYNGWWAGSSSGRTQNVWTQNVSQNAAPSGGETGALSEAGPVSLGQISVKAQVSAVFSLK
jgi:uncharacterized protein